MSQTQIQKPIVQGVVSEPTIGSLSDNNRNNDNDDEPSDDSGNTSGKDEDSFGEKFEIPAFLRKIH